MDFLFFSIFWKSLNSENHFFPHSKYTFSYPLDSAARSGRTLPTTITHATAPCSRRYTKYFVLLLKIITNRYWVCACILALVTRHANRIFLCRIIILSSVTCLTVPYFSTLSHKWQDFRQKLKIKCDFTLQIVSTTFIVLRIILRDIHVHWCLYNVPVILVRF